MSTNWRTPKSEKLLALEALMREQTEEIRALRPHLSDEEVTEVLLATPQIAALCDEVQKELNRRLIEKWIDEKYFVYGKRCIPDEELRRMSDPELAAWCQRAGVIFAQVKAHLAERFPETRLQVVDGGTSK
jgi:hypothetical protein